MIQVISKGALPHVEDLTVAHSQVRIIDSTDGSGQVVRVDLIVAGSPIRIRRFREALGRTKIVHEPTLGQDPIVAFTFDLPEVAVDEDDLASVEEALASATLTTATTVVREAMSRSVLPAAHEAPTQAAASADAPVQDAQQPARGRPGRDRTRVPSRLPASAYLRR